ncbi:MAG: tRNA preQ1(34) S-adenosylmethionine ribosyltransferase-isomerase QueA [Abditibacteriales bacterium]|nr:tRNA preQ1(34) S-adenosylmethionine ribosyltransferase-isomerase QueA [Abditibacteriales bacterium]MDW8368079.1 tRNA preQ1(34) S-adenosylmethionine ribosyltransferase-isomerase QueA [Abditibacteriales bacterium]
MDIALFDYNLPPELIAQEPLRERDHSRLLVLERATGAIQHRRFFEIGEFLRAGDLLVLNDTRVFRARLRGRKEPTGGKVEVLLLREVEAGLWEALVKPGRNAKVGSTLSFGEETSPSPSSARRGERGTPLLGKGRLRGVVRMHVEGRTDFGGRLLRVEEAQTFREKLRTIGEVPTPPYIHRPVTDENEYQTVYAREEGSVAAPTAGFHFTTALLERLRAQGVEQAFVTLHVGIDTFRPIQEKEIERHQMHAEFYAVPAATAEAIARTRQRGGRVIAVGTTTVRTLESAGSAEAGGTAGTVVAGSGWTRLFITPGYQFRVVDAMVTNFHLPRSTLLLLVSAFAGRETVLRAYEEAVRHRYRFYSFGDAMLIL